MLFVPMCTHPIIVAFEPTQTQSSIIISKATPSPVDFKISTSIL